MKKQNVFDTVFTAVDVETTGLSQVRDKIIELGMVKFCGNDTADTYHALYNPGFPIPEDSSKVHGIQNKDVEGQAPIENSLHDIASFFQGSILVAHNAQFDMGFLRAAFQRSGLKMATDLLVLDTLKIARKAYPGRRSYSLQALAVDLNIDSGNAHRAVDDALTCMKVFLKCADALSFMGEIQVEELI